MVLNVPPPMGIENPNQQMGDGRISYRRLYRILEEHENLIGFWRRSGNNHTSSPPLVCFEWAQFSITGSRISPSKNHGYAVIKKPFLWMSVSSDGEAVNYIDPDGRFTPMEDGLLTESELAENELTRVNVSFIGESHFVVEESYGFSGFTRVSSGMRGEDNEDIYGSPPAEIYQYFANRTSPSGNGSSRRQRKKEKLKQMRKMEPEHFVKIVNCSPTTSRPLQGLWKGVGDEGTLDLYLVSYDDVGGLACRKVGNSNTPLAYHAPMFWTSSSMIMKFPFSSEENKIYSSRLHLSPPWASEDENEMHVSGVVRINSSYDLVIPGLVGNAVNLNQFEGRIWLYEDGTFGFGFLRDGFIVDLKHVAKDGQIMDAIEPDDQ